MCWFIALFEAPYVATPSTRTFVRLFMILSSHPKNAESSERVFIVLFLPFTLHEQHVGVEISKQGMNKAEFIS